MSDDSITVTVRVQVMPPHLLNLVHDHTSICHGETGPSSRHPEDAGVRIPFRLGITADGMRLVLYRAGHLPQAIAFSDLVGAWLVTNGHLTP